MNKNIRTLLLLLCLSLCLSLGSVCLASEYTYTVTLYAGSKGVFEGAPYTGPGEISLTDDCLTITGLRYGDSVNFGAVYGNSVRLTEGDKYYIRGVRLSGRDNDTVSSPAFTVTEDTMLVVAYGIQGNLVAYTVQYLDSEGKSLLPAETCYGNVGDKPVVAYRYVEGYQPAAYNMTGTLSANAEENLFTFTYRALNATTENGQGSVTVPTEAPARESATPASETTVSVIQATDAFTQPQETIEDLPEEPLIQATDAFTQPAETIEEFPEEPAELVDLDELEVPLASAQELTAADAVRYDASVKQPRMLWCFIGMFLFLLLAGMLLFARRNWRLKTMEEDRMDRALGYVDTERDEI